MLLTASRLCITMVPAVLDVSDRSTSATRDVTSEIVI